MSRNARISTRIAALALATLMPAGTTFADSHFKFHVVFYDGTLAGQLFTGYFTADQPYGGFVPGGTAGHRLTSLSITIGGVQFEMEDDTAFPKFPKIAYFGGPQCDHIDFDGHKGSTFSGGKSFWIVCNSYSRWGDVAYGTHLDGTFVYLAKGWVYDVTLMNMYDEPWVPGCMQCHGRSRP